MIRFLRFIVFWTLASSTALSAAPAEWDLLSADEAFRVSARRADGHRLALDYDIAPGYHLYRNRLAFAIDNPAVTVGSVQLPEPRVVFDRALGETVAHYVGRITVFLTLAGADVPVHLTAKGQGCAADRLCYPPFSRTFVVPASGGING